VGLQRWEAIDAGSPAAEAHIGESVTAAGVEWRTAESVNGLAQRIASTNPGQTIALEVLRGGKPLTIQVQIAERPRH